MTRRARPVTTSTVNAAPEAPPPPPTAEELLSELRRYAARRHASASAAAAAERASVARIREGAALSEAWTLATLIAHEATADAWRDVLSHLQEESEKP